MSASLSGCRQLIDDFKAESAPCSKTGYPPPPRTGHSSSRDAVEFVVALKTMDAGDSGPTGARVGYNVDGACTSSVDTSSCVPIDPSQVPIDGPDGVDNALGQVVFRYYKGPRITEGLQGHEQSGDNAYLLLITGYNGESDDPEVSAAIVSGTTLEADGSGSAPKWDGTDVWKPFATWVSGTAPPVAEHFADRAYVSGGVLVTEFAALPLSGPSDKTATYGNVFTGQLNASSGSYHLENGMRAARWAMPSVLGFLAYLEKLGHQWPDPNDCTIPDDSIYLGDGGWTYSNGKIHACDAADVRIEGGDRRHPCDALSMGMVIEGTPARLGDVAPVTDASGLCEVDNCSYLGGSADAD